MSASETPRTDAASSCCGIPICLANGMQQVPADFARQLERELAAARARVAELNERLENNHYFDNDGNRVECEPGTILDGIDCRDETIKMLEIHCDSMRDERDALRAALKALLRDIPIVECNDFHHAKADQNHAFDACPPLHRWNAAVEQACAAIDAARSAK